MPPRTLPGSPRPAKDPQTITPEGDFVRSLIDGVIVRPAQTIEDRRGEIVEMYRPAWGLHADPLVFVYQVLIRPGAVKGWVVHERQEDRLFMSMGVLRWALYDARPDSPTHGQVNDLVFSDRNRGLLVIPRGVYHAVRNIGTGDALFINMPTRPYDHADPDKFRLPLENGVIPFSFDDGPGW